MQAVQVLDSVIMSILSGEVNVESIDTITRQRKNFEELVRCHYGPPNAKAGVDCPEVLQMTRDLAANLAQFEETVQNLQFLCARCSLILPATSQGRG